MVIWLDDYEHGACAPGIVGGKAAPLGQLFERGYAIPNGFSTRLDDKMPDIIEAYQYLSEFGRYPVAVRSSALDEDSGGHAFAGMHESVLNVRSEDEFIDATRKVAASFYNERALAYRAANGLPVDSIRPVLFVQLMVDAEFAAVSMSHHQITGEPRITVETVRGLGEALVQGEADPNTYVNGEFVFGDEADEGQHRMARAVFELTESLAATQTFPVDVESAMDKDGKLWLLQCRPITSIRKEGE